APPGGSGSGSGSGNIVPVGRTAPGSAADTDWGPPNTVSTGTGKMFRVPNGGGMSLRGVARITLGTEQRWDEIYRLNPTVKPDDIFPPGTELRLPPDARVQ